MKIYVLQDCGYSFMFHWVIFMLGGLRKLPATLENPVPIYFNFPTQSVGMKVEKKSVHTESLELIQHLYPFTEPKEGDELIELKGEPLFQGQPDMVDSCVYSFLRNLFLSSPLLPIPNINKEERKKYYITRKDLSVNPANKGRNMRQITNEEEFTGELEKMGFEIIALSDYCFKDKIEMFRNASMIVSPHGGALTFSLFAPHDCKIVEILPQHIQAHNHYMNMCRELKIPYYRFIGVNTTGNISLCTNWSMSVKVQPFLSSIRSFSLHPS